MNQRTWGEICLHLFFITDQFFKQDFVSAAPNKLHVALKGHVDGSGEKS